MATLVTGSSGMLGRALCALLKNKGPVQGVSASGSGGGLACDLSNASAVRALFESNPVDFVIHTAAYSDVDGCERDPKRAHEANTLAPKNLSEVCSARNIPWIHVSTDYVFNGSKNGLYVETDRAFPVSIYGQTKWLGEFYASRSASPCAIVRTSWLFGPGNPRTFVNVMLERIQRNESVSVLDNQTTAPTSVKDLSLALVRLLEFMRAPGAKKQNHLFHVCNNGGTTHFGIASAIRDILGKKEVRVEKTDPSKIPNRVAIRPTPASTMSPAHFEGTVGLKMRPWKEALKEYIQECAS